MKGMYKRIQTDGTDQRFISLCKELDQFLYHLIGSKVQSSQYDQYNGLEDIKDVCILLEGTKPVACGSFKQYEDRVAEIKRVFVKKEYRRNGLARMVMDNLEEEAREKGYHELILETGKVMIGARKLYEACGYSYIPNYGPYKNNSQSVCMKKVI